MPGKRARKHFSQLSEFERGLIIGIKTEGWSTRRVAGQVDRSECEIRNCWEQWTQEDTLQKQILNPSALSVHSLYHRNIGNCVYSGAKPDQCGMSQVGKWLCLVMHPGLFWGQMITVNGCGGALVRGTIPPYCSTSHCPHSWCNGLGDIAYDSRSTLIVMRGTLTSQRYVDDILRPHGGPFLNDFPEAIFRQDNARPHTARVAQDFLRYFQTLPLPAHCPDLSPVEHVWDKLKQ
ncbi:transposable element Tcb2 transposase [Trichonephila clavipes]|nr:transposable element Tcb2 transposase [Trichonephila clavipes]